MAAARDATVAILSYRADTVEADLTAARDRITGAFLDSVYTDLVDRTVIPAPGPRGYRRRPGVPAASVSARGRSRRRVGIRDQTITMEDVQSSTASRLRVTLDKVGERWLVSGFDPV